MANTQEFVTIIKLNDQEAKNNLEQLRKKVEDLKAARDKAIASKDDNDFIKSMNKALKAARSELKAYDTNVRKTMQTLENLSTSSVSDIEKAMRALKRMQKDATNPDEWNRMQTLIDKCRDRIDDFKNGMKGAASETQNLAKVMGNLNNASLNQLNRAKAYLEGQVSDMNPKSTSYATAISQLQEVKARIQQVNAEQQRLVTTVDRYNAEIEQAGQEARKVAKSSELINRTLGNLKTSSVRDLQYSLKLVNEEMHGMDRGTKEFRAMEHQAKRLRTELEKVRSEGAAQKSWIGSTADWFNRMQGMIFSLVASFTGLSITIRKCISNFAQMDQEMTDVMKYTGQTKDEVKAMNEEFKKMNTRTPREKLNQLAGDAGRLGIKTSEMVQEFVDGADKINVALGDDLGEDAVKNIGKLATLFGEDKRKGLRGAMLATGSAVNELSQNSSASAGYLVDFTARLSGVGKQANITQQQIMGYASVLDQNMQQDETAATAMQTLITKMFQEPAKFAALAGKNVKEFSTLLKTDANQAILQFFDAMKAKGGFADLAPMFDKMNLNGVRATGVLSVMADKLEDVKAAQELANKAYDDGTSVIKEFDTQMSSEQAKLDMAGKAFKDLSIDLGEQLLPVARYTISTAGTLVKALYNIVTFVKDNISSILKLSVVLTVLGTVYKAGTIYVYLWYVKEHMLLALQKLSVVWTKTKISVVTALKVAYYLLTGQIQKVKDAMQAMKAASITNPYTALLTVVLSLAAGIYAIVKAIKAHDKAVNENLLSVRKLREQQKDLADAQKEVNQSTAEEKTRIERLTNIIKSNVYSYGERKNAMIALEKIVPGYHRNLDNEATLTKENNKALKEYVDNLNDAAMAQALYNKMVELQGKKFDLETEVRKHNNSKKAVQAEIDRHPEYYNATTSQTFFGTVGNAVSVEGTPTKANIKKHNELRYWDNATKESAENLAVVQTRIKSINDYMDKNRGVREQYDKIMRKNKETQVDSPTVFKPGDTKTEKEISVAERKARQERKKKLNEEIKVQKAQTDLLQAQNIIAYNENKKDYRKHIEDRHAIAIKGYDDLIAIYKKYGEEYKQIEDERAQEMLAADNDKNKFLLSDAERNYQKKVALVHEAYQDINNDAYMDEAALNEALFEADMSFMNDRLRIAKRGTEEYFNVMAEMEGKERQHRFEREQYYIEKVAQYREQWGRIELKKQEEIAINGLEDLHEKKKISEIEYLEMMREIKLAFQEQESEENLRNSKGEVAKRHASTAFKIAKNNATAEYENTHDTNSVGSLFTSDVSIYMSTMEQLKQMYAGDAKNYAEYQEAKRQATANFLENMVSKMQAAYDQINQVMSAMTTYYEAQSNYEQSIVTKKYDKQIEAAGNNQKKSKILEEKKQKELAKIKSKYNKKAMKIEIAQAFATTAMAAINAYASAPKPTMVWGPIAAAMATAAGMMQIATIKKQHAAQEEGYYKGGFTGGRRYRKEAGIVHEGEFVANHDAVNNTRILPALQLIDQAQRNNTVGNLTADDVSRSLGKGMSTVVSSPSITVQNNNEELNSTLADTNQVMESLQAVLSAGIMARVSLEDFDREWKHYQQLKNNK